MACFLYEEDVICRHLAPTIVITDNGTPFINELISKVYNGFYIEHRRTSIFYASASEFILISQEDQEIQIAGNKDKSKPPFSIGNLVMKYNDSVVHDLSKKLQDR